MAAAFDNLDDVTAKFTGTICYYDKKPVVIKSVGTSNEKKGKFIVSVTSSGGRAKIIELDDPLFNYRDYNLGYANSAHYAAWWFRKPTRQYRQGLKRDQLGWQSSAGMLIEENFSFSKNYIAMLENNYPTLAHCQDVLAEGETQIMAFHRDFAITWDRIHQDFILEYRGNKVGSGCEKFKLIDSAMHLQEALQEALR